MFTQIDSILQSQNLSSEAFFLVDGGSGGFDLRRVTLEQAAEASLTTSFKKTLEDKVIKPNSGASSVPLVSTLVDRGNKVFEYDHQTLNHLPVEFTKISDVLNQGVLSNTPKFDFSTQKLSDVKGFIYHLCDGAGNSVVVYQHKYQVTMHRKTKASYFSLNGRTLDKIDYDSIDINGNIDFFYFNSKYYCIDIKVLERNYGLEQVINNMASQSIPSILNLNLFDCSNIQNPQDIFKDMYHDRSFMRRLSQIRSSTLVSNGSITIQMVDAVRQQFPVFQRNLNVTNGFIDMTTKEHKRYFIRLLNNEASFAALNQEPFLAVDKDSAA